MTGQFWWKKSSHGSGWSENTEESGRDWRAWMWSWQGQGRAVDTWPMSHVSWVYTSERTSPSNVAAKTSLPREEVSLKKHLEFYIWSWQTTFILAPQSSMLPRLWDTTGHFLQPCHSLWSRTSRHSVNKEFACSPRRLPWVITSLWAWWLKPHTRESLSLFQHLLNWLPRITSVHHTSCAS